ncbi:hypothetical protein [Prevotella dentasini]
MRCTCPYCSQSLLVRLPRRPVVVSQQAGSSEPHPTARPLPEKPGGMARMLVAVLGVVLLGGGAVAGFVCWQHHETEEAALEQRQRKAHRDSVARLQQALRNKAIAEAQARRRQESTCRFIESFYRKAVLAGGDPTFYGQYLTDNCRVRLFGAPVLDERYEAIQRVAWWETFGSLSASPDLSVLAANLRVWPDHDDWYRVRLSQDGVTEFKLVKVVYTDGSFLIDDVE